MPDPTAADHTHHSLVHRQEALNFFRTRWKTTSLKPARGIWTLVKIDPRMSRITYMHHLCNLARGHATMAHRLSTNNLRLIPLK